MSLVIWSAFLALAVADAQPAEAAPTQAAETENADALNGPGAPDAPGAPVVDAAPVGEAAPVVDAVPGATAPEAAGDEDAPAPAFADEDDAAVVDRVRDHIEAMTTLTGRFTQVGPSGQAVTGAVWIKRPGFMRVEYDPPSPLLLVVNDGTLYERDEDLETTNAYPAGRTPLRYLLRKRLDLDKATILAVERGPSGIAVTLASRDDEEPGAITLVFDAPELQLRQWIVEDAQRGVTVFTLHDVALGEKIRNSRFRIPDAGGTFLKD